MRILRSTMISPMPELIRTTVVVRDVDMAVPLEEIGTTGEFGFVFEDIFTVPDGTDIVRATAKATARINETAERDMAILYYWTHMNFQLLKPSGMVMSPKPAPLNEEQIRKVWRMLAALPDYENFNFMTTTNEGRQIYFKERTDV